MAGPTNEDRAAWAEDAVNEFASTTFFGRRFTETVVEQPNPGEDAHNMVTDLICNLFHLAAKHGWDIDDIMRIARGDFDEEVAEAEGTL